MAWHGSRYGQRHQPKSNTLELLIICFHEYPRVKESSAFIFYSNAETNKSSRVRNTVFHESRAVPGDGIVCCRHANMTSSSEVTNGKNCEKPDNFTRLSHGLAPLSICQGIKSSQMLPRLVNNGIIVDFHVLFTQDHDLFKYESSYWFPSRATCVSFGRSLREDREPCRAKPCEEPCRLIFKDAKLTTRPTLLLGFRRLQPRQTSQASA